MGRWLCSRGEVPPKVELGVYAPTAWSASCLATMAWHGVGCEYVFVSDLTGEIQIFRPSPSLLDSARFARGVGYWLRKMEAQS